VRGGKKVKNNDYLRQFPATTLALLPCTDRSLLNASRARKGEKGDNGKPARRKISS
jgi:hypothetical protein